MISTIGSDFNSRLIAPPMRTFGIFFGDPGTGKTYTLLRHLPQPVAYFWFDNRSLNELAEARAAGRQILDIQITMPSTTLNKGELEKEGKAIWDKIISNLLWAAKKSQTNEIRSIAFDTVTEATDIIKYSYDGSLKNVRGGSKGDYVNRQWLRVADIVRTYRANLILTSRESEIWSEGTSSEWGKPLGLFKPRCPSGVLQAVDWSAHLRFKKNLLKRLLPEIELEVLKSGENRSAMGKIIDQEKWEGIDLTPFQYLMTYVFERGDVDDWKP